jgi:predicted GH43/DUF377 family glycosyl hydrolase
MQFSRRSLLAAGAALSIAASDSASRPAAAEGGPVGPPLGGPGKLLGPGPEGRWDDERVSSPCVVRGADGTWRMWYYGRDKTFPRGISLPTGRVGLATSKDGLNWTRIDGPLARGAVFGPSGDEARFDAAHVGVSHVEQRGSTWWMWYFGGRMKESERAGFPLRPGLALSGDGLNWFRVEGPFGGAFLDVGKPDEEDAFMAGWPQVLQAPDGSWRMYYHTRAKAGFVAMLAVSEDGFRWRKRGAILRGGEKGAFDEDGVATRTVFRHQGRWLMLYEGVMPGLYRGMGLAESADGLTWKKVKGGAIAGAVFGPAPKGSGRWDTRGLGCPSVVAMEDGSLRMYYIGSNEFPPGGNEMASVHQIGLAVSPKGDPTQWVRWEA